MSGGRVATPPRGVEDMDSGVVALWQVVDRAPVEDDGHIVVVQVGEAPEAFDERARRAVAIAPPAVRSAADHVHPVDEQVHGSDCIARTAREGKTG